MWRGIQVGEILGYRDAFNAVRHTCIHPKILKHSDSEVCDILGYTNSRKTVAAHCKHSKIISVTKRDGIRGNPNQTIIPESDLYRLIMRSRLPRAKEFEAWVCEVVLPSIRKTGGYIHGADEMSPEEIMARALQIADKTIKEKQRVIEQQSERLMG